MKSKAKAKIQFVVDPLLISNDQSELLIRVLQEEKIKFITNLEDLDDLSPGIFFLEKKSLRKVSRFKNKMIIIPSEESTDLSMTSLNYSSYEDISHFIKKFFWAEKHLLIQERLKESEKVYETIKNFLEESAHQNSDVEGRKTYEMFLDLELSLLQEEVIEKWNPHFKVFLKKNPDIQNIILVKSEELSHVDYTIDENVLIFKLPLQDYYLYMRLKNFEVFKYAEIIDVLLSICLRTLQIFDQKLVKSDGEIDFWKKIFSKIPYPMAIISSLGDLLIYNESFAKIGILPKECLRFKDLESSEIFQNFYKIRRIDFPINLIQVSYFVFYTAEKEQIQNSGEKSSKKTSSKSSSVDDLGIISSSIAHELNNPLAGILAALSLLSLEENWTEEALSDLDDMKSGAKRCKELVEIFLGFSKFSVTPQTKVSIKGSLDQAINLLRFRMIESNMRLEMKYSPTLENFSHQINSSIMSMIFYLVCSELMTAFAHHRLLTMGQNGVLAGEVLELSNQIVLKLDDDFEYEEKIAQSKLIQHLLIFEKLEINFLKQVIRLIYRT
jgi:signal transduction histidine kinase